MLQMLRVADLRTSQGVPVEAQLGDDVLRDLGLQRLLGLPLRRLQQPVEILRVELLQPATRRTAHLMVTIKIPEYRQLQQREGGG